MQLDHDDMRPAVIAEGIHRLDLDRLQFPSSFHEPLVFKDVAEVQTASVAQKVVAPKCVRLRPGTEACSVIATFQNNEPGLARIELKIDANTVTRWVWLTSDEKMGVLFAGLTDLRGAGKHRIQCGTISLDLDAGHTAE